MSGRIVTFYSWKGGVGRTVALANIGVQLARRGKRVLLVDWDLEAPGLDRYFHSEESAQYPSMVIRPPGNATGLLGALADASSSDRRKLIPEDWKSRCMEILLPALPAPHAGLSPTSPHPLHVLGSGLGSSDFVKGLQNFSWVNFFAEHRGGDWLESLRNQWRESYDFVLIDSRTGLTDSGGVCTVQMPDTLVLVFTANAQSLRDGLDFINGVHRARAGFPFERAPLSVVPLLSRWDGQRETDLANQWLGRIEKEITPLVELWLPKDFSRRRLLERLRVPHVARFTFGEPLPVLTHSLTDPELPGLAYDLLAELFAKGFSEAGQILDPTYRPAFDPAHATDAEINRLILDDPIRDSEIKRIEELYGAESSSFVEFLLRLARNSIRIGRISLADELTRRAVQLARGLALKNSSDSAGSSQLFWALLLQGEIRQIKGNLTEAALAFQQSFSMVQRLAESDPSNIEWQRNLSVSLDSVGKVRQDQGDLVRALIAFQESLDVSRRLAGADSSNTEWQRDLSVSLMNVGNVQQTQGDLIGALTAFQESLSIMQRLAEADPSNTEWQRDLSISLNNVGKVRQNQGDLDRALVAFQESLDVRRKLAGADPSNTQWQRDLSISINNVGRVRQNHGDLVGAITSFQESLEVSRRLTGADPSNTQWHRDLGINFNNVGSVRQIQGDLVGALNAFQESLDVSRRLAGADPSNTQWQRDLSISLNNVGLVRQTLGDFVGALTAFQETLDVRRRLADADPSNTEWQRDFSLIHTAIAQFYALQENRGLALIHAEESLAIDERLSRADSTNAIWQEDVKISRALVSSLKADEDSAENSTATN
jgi:tetratricopeptide (TPR) repeat protein